MVKITYKGLNLTRTKVTNRIIKTFLDASDKDKFDWYKDLTKLMNYCTGNMVSYHLTTEQRELLYSDAKIDTTHTSLRYS